MKRFPALILALACLLLSAFRWETGACAAGAAPTAGRVTTSAASLNVRGGASTSHAVVATLARGSVVTLHGKSGGWWRVGLPGGKYGYCNADFVAELSGSAARRVAANALNVRGAPSQSGAVRAVLYRGAVVVRLSSSGDFAKILYDGTKVGYASAAYLEAAGSGSAPRAKYAAVSLGVPSYKQMDGRWAAVRVGASGKTIAEIGCATTALAMTESYRTGASVTPDAMAGRLTYSSGGSLYWPGIYTATGAVGYDELYGMLKAGTPVIVGARNAAGGTHFVVVKGFSGGDSLTASGFAINDPGSNSRTTLAQLLSLYPTMYRTVYCGK